MCSSGRIAPFFLTFSQDGHCGHAVSTNGGVAGKPVSINSAQAIELSNDHFDGKMLIIHQTGNEPQCEGADGSAHCARSHMHGVELQIQGRFKQAGPGGRIVLWAGGELTSQLKLGWFTQKVVALCLNFAKMKTQGRVFCRLGNETENALMGFPFAQIFTVIVTKAGETPPELGSRELSQAPWQGPGQIDVNGDDVYTLSFKTPFLDLCSWELLNVPGVSPLPLEKLLGDISSSRIMLYDLAAAGTHGNWREGVILEWFFCRGEPGMSWYTDKPATGCHGVQSDGDGVKEDVNLKSALVPEEHTDVVEATDAKDSNGDRAQMALPLEDSLARYPGECIDKQVCGADVNDVAEHSENSAEPLPFNKAQNGARQRSFAKDVHLVSGCLAFPKPKAVVQLIRAKACRRS